MHKPSKIGGLKIKGFTTFPQNPVVNSLIIIDSFGSILCLGATVIGDKSGISPRVKPPKKFEASARTGAANAAGAGPFFFVARNG